MKNKEIEESIKRIKGIVDFYKLNDDNNYDYSDDVLISMKNLLSYIEQLEKRNKEIYDGFMATQEELTDYAMKNEQLENNRSKARKMIFDNYGVLDKYGIEMLDDILKGDNDE